MVLPTVVVAVVATVVVLYRHLARRHREHALWRSAFFIGVGIGGARALLAPTGWYVVEHTGGPLQIPAFLLTMLALPEAIVFSGQRGPASAGLLLLLGGLLLATTIAVVSAVALLVVAVHRGR